MPPITRPLPLRLHARLRRPCLFLSPFSAVPARSKSHSAASTPSNDPDSFQHPFRICHDVEPLRTYRKQIASCGRSVGLVPTMGALHDGHLSLIRAAAAENTDVFVSIFVNPTQFGPTEDLSTYPRTWDEDIRKLENLNRRLSFPNTIGKVSLIFNPSASTMYPTLPPTGAVDGDGSFVSITPLARKLEGRSRPTFFRGVATVCMKLFNIFQPDRVYFGQKDIQQSILIRRMVKDFHIATDVRVVAISRELDGLAMSSRNTYLGNRRRSVAPVLNRALMAAKDRYQSGIVDARELVGVAREILSEELDHQKALEPFARALFKVDYVALTDVDEMDVVEGEVDRSKGAVLSAAVKMLPVEIPLDKDEKSQKPVRLIDNTILNSQNLRY